MVIYHGIESVKNTLNKSKSTFDVGLKKNIIPSWMLWEIYSNLENDFLLDVPCNEVTKKQPLLPFLEDHPS